MDTITIFVICYGGVWASYILIRLFFLFLYSHPWFFEELFENARGFCVNILCRCLPGSVSAKLYDRFLNEHDEIPVEITEYQELLHNWLTSITFK